MGTFAGQSASGSGNTSTPGYPRGTATGTIGPYDPTGDLLGAIMGAAGGGLDVPGSPGTMVGGGMVSQAGLRAALQQSGAQAEADRANVYGQVNQALLARDPGITSGYNAAGQTLEDNAAQRAAADQGYALQRQSQAAQAAAALGLSVAPDANAAANQTMLNSQRTYQSIADSWKGFDSAAGQSALERNHMTADAFTHEGVLQQAALQAQLQNALSRAADYYVSGRVVGGSKGSTLSPASRLAALEYAATFGLNQQKAKQAASPKTSVSKSTQSVNKAGQKVTTTKSTRG